MYSNVKLNPQMYQRNTSVFAKKYKCNVSTIVVSVQPMLPCCEPEPGTTEKKKITD